MNILGSILGDWKMLKNYMDLNKNLIVTEIDGEPKLNGELSDAVVL